MQTIGLYISHESNGMQISLRAKLLAVSALMIIGSTQEALADQNSVTIKLWNRYAHSATVVNVVGINNLPARAKSVGVAQHGTRVVITKANGGSCQFIVNKNGAQQNASCSGASMNIVRQGPKVLAVQFGV